MRLLPYDQLTLRTESPPEVVEAKLARLVSTHWFSVGRPPEPFRGKIDGAHFKISVVPGFLTRNSFEPVVVGDIVPVAEGTEIRVSIRLNALVLAFLTFWAGGILLGGASMVGRTGVASGAIPLGMLLFAYGLVSIGFWPLAKKARRLLCEGLGCREADAPNRLVRG